MSDKKSFNYKLKDEEKDIEPKSTKTKSTIRKCKMDCSNNRCGLEL